MKTTQLNRRRATWRNPRFKKDYKKYVQLKRSLKQPDDKSGLSDSDSEKLIRKEYELEKKWGFPVTLIANADAVAGERKIASAIRPVTRISDDPYVIVFKNEKPWLLVGDALYLKLNFKDITVDGLVKDFKKVIRPYHDLFLKNISAEGKIERDRKTDIHKKIKDIDIWDIYDLYIKTKKNISKTTRILFDIKHPHVREDHDNEYHQVKTAIKNAEAMINSGPQKSPL
jgi:hypothetical protein